MKSIEDLRGAEISAVAFVRDYVEIHFDGPTLRCIAHPTINVEDKVVQFPKPGSRDALCSVIGLVINCIKLEDGASCELSVSNGSRISIPLDNKHRRGHESMHFCSGLNAPVDVW